MNGSPELFAALAKFQRHATNVHKKEKAVVPTKSGGSFTYSYADIAGVIESIREPLAACGLCYTQMLTHIDGRPALMTALAHESGANIGETVPFSGDLSDPQKFGGIVTYYRRYALLSILGLATDDDDAQSASPPQPSGHAQRAYQAQRESHQSTTSARPEPSQRAEGEMDWSDLWAKVLRPKGIMSAQRLTELIGGYESLSAAQVSAKVNALGDIPKWTPPSDIGDGFEVVEMNPPRSPSRPQYPASDKQISFIKSLLTKKGMDDKAWPGWAAYALDVDDAPDVDNLSSKQASAVIEQLKEMPDNPGLAAALEASGR
jgi:hypothetical protein